MIKFMDLSYQYGLIKNELMAVLEDIFERNQFIGGLELTNFESEFAKYCGIKNCIGVGNGTDALELAFEALKLPAKSKVLVPANSFIASAEAISRCGLTPKFIEFDKSSYLIDDKIISRHIDDDVSAIVAVHLYGRPVDVKRIKNLTSNSNIKIIEDCAQAHGAMINGDMVGTLGDIGCFSFYPGKNLGAYGDAGSLITNDDKLAERIRRLANHGRLQKFDHELIGRNSRLDNIQAAVLRLKLRRLDEWNRQRRANAQTYIDHLNVGAILKIPTIEANEHHVFHHFVVQVKDRDNLKNYLLSEGVETGIHYPGNINSFNAYANYSSKVDDFGLQIISLPIAEHLNQSDIIRICTLINKFYS